MQLKEKGGKKRRKNCPLLGRKGHPGPVKGEKREGIHQNQGGDRGNIPKDKDGPPALLKR